MEENTKTSFKLSTNSYIDYFVKSTAEFDAFADFEPITRLGKVEAVEKYKELQDKGISCGIGINIRNDLIFDTPEGSGITVLIRNEDGKDTLNIMGDSFIKELKSPDQHSLDVVLAFENIYNEAKKQGLNIEEAPYIKEKKLELFGKLQKTTLVNGDIVVNSDSLPGTNRTEEKIINNIEIKPVLLEEILDVMEMRPEVTPEGRIKVFDLQRQEYIDNRSDLPPFDEDNWTFSNASEIFERLDVYINDYYVRDMQEQLEDAGIEITGNETLSDLCILYKTELENGNDNLSLGELNLAMGIVNPETVIMPKKDIVQNKSKIHDEKINYVLEKLKKAGIEVVTDKEEFERIIASNSLLQKMYVDLKEFENTQKQIQMLKEQNENIKRDNHALIREQSFIDFQTSLIACKKFIKDLPEQKLPTIQYKTKKDKGEEIIYPFDIKIRRNHLGNDELLLMIGPNIQYHFESKIIEINAGLEIFKDLNLETDCSKVLVETINNHLGKQLGEQRKIFKSLMEENALLSGKDLKELSPEETKELKEKLKEKEYENVEGIFVHKDKKIAVTPDVYVSEIQNAKLLVDQNYTVYLLPENFAFKRKNEFGQNESYSAPDTLTNHEFVELKTTNKKISERFGDAVEQSNNVLIRIKDDISLYNARKRLQEKVRNLPKEKKITVKDGNVFLYFEKRAQFIAAEIKNGKINILPTLPKLADLSVVPPANINISEKDDLSSLQNMVSNGTTYGFTHNRKIYLNPDVMNSEAAVHEYTHLWDAYTQKTNPELWQKGLNIFKNTSIWNEVIEDENYADIKNDENLVLSECHARICGKIADIVLQNVIEEDGDLKKAEMIDWDKETWAYIASKIGFQEFDKVDPDLKLTTDDLKLFLSSPMKDLFQHEINLKLEQNKDSIKNDIELTPEQWRACDALAEKAKMDWWFEEYGSDGDIHKDVSKEDLNDLSTAFDGYLTIDEKYRKPIMEIFKRANIEFNDITLLTTQEISSRAENLYGFYFEYNDDEKCSDIYRSEDGAFVGSYSDGGFGYADGMGIDVPKIPDEVFQDVIALSRQFYIESEKENERTVQEKNMDSFVRHTIIDEQKMNFLEFPKVFNTPKSLGLSEKEHFAYYQYELSLNQIKTIASAESDIVKMVEKNTDSPEQLDVHFVFDREHNKLSDFYIRYNKNNNTYTSSYVAGEVRESDISKNMQENLCKIFEGVFKMNQEIQTGAAEKVQSVSLSDLQVEELREGLKYALNEVAQPLPEIDFTRENYNKLFPRDRLNTPIETVKIGAHQFEKLEVKDRKNLLQAVHDVLSNPDVIINEEKESIFGDMENSHVYAKSYVINEKTKAVQSVVVNIEDEYISISTHKRDISNVVNKIKKPDQLLFAAAKVRLLAEQHTKEKLSQSVVNPNRENEYVIPPQTNIPQTQEKSSDEKSIESFNIKGEKYSFSEAEQLLKEDISSVFQELDSSEIEQNLTLNGVKIYGNPEKDGKIKLLVEFDSKNSENRWSEDSLFNAIAEEKITFNGMEVDINPITPEKSGTIEEYLSRLERLGAVSEAEAIEKQEELIASREEVKDDKQVDDVLEQCNKILDKYSNTHFTELEQRYINECETKNDDRHQVLMSLCNMKYVHVSTKDKNGYWEIKKGKEISANEARKLMSYDDFASGLDRASFHLTAGRNTNDGSFVYFNDSERKRDIQPYELTKEDYLLLSQYEKAGGSTEVIPESILQQLSQYNINANIENPKILSWQEIEDYFSVRNVRETKNEILESFTESQEKPAEKELKEECVARLLENQIDFYGFDTNKTDNKLNSEISVAKWDVLEKIAEKTVLKELDLKPYAVIQEEADKLLMENPVFQECIKNGIISTPDFLSEADDKKNIELTADDIKNVKALLPKEQYQLVLGYTQGEEGEHFKGIIKEISSKAEAIKGKSEILTEDEKHPLAFKYTLGNSSFYFSEWDGADELFGYAVLNGDTQMSEWGYTSLEELKNAGSKAGNGFPVLPEMIFYGLEDTIEKQISVDYPELSEKMGFEPKKNHNEKLISEFGKEIFETLETRKLEHNSYNICCAAQYVLRSMDSSESKEIFSIMEKCGCKGKNGKAKTIDFLTEVVNAENNTALAVYDRKKLYEKINKSCEAKNHLQNNKNLSDDYDIEM